MVDFFRLNFSKLILEFYFWHENIHKSIDRVKSAQVLLIIYFMIHNCAKLWCHKSIELKKSHQMRYYWFFKLKTKSFITFYVCLYTNYAKMRHYFSRVVILNSVGTHFLDKPSYWMSLMFDRIFSELSRILKYFKIIQLIHFFKSFQSYLVWVWTWYIFKLKW